MKRLSLKKAKAWLEENKGLSTIVAQINSQDQLTFKDGNGKILSAAVKVGWDYREKTEEVMLQVISKFLIYNYGKFIKKMNANNFKALSFYNKKKTIMQARYSPSCLVSINPESLQGIQEILSNMGFILNCVYEGGMFQDSQNDKFKVWTIQPLI